MDFGIGEKDDSHGPLKPHDKSSVSGQAVPPFTQDIAASSHFEDELMREFDQKHSKLSSFLEETAPLKTETKTSGHQPSEMLQHSFGVSSYAEEELMRQFDQQHSKLSSFLDDRSADLTSSLPPHTESQHHQDYNEFEIMKKSEDDDLKKLIGDGGATSSSPNAFKGIEKTEPGAGDHRHDLSQFERVSPNMMNFSYDDPVSSKNNSDLLVDFQATPPLEVPFSGGHDTYVPFARTTAQEHQFDEDDEDDFEKDSISQQSQPLSSKLSDSLEALKDIPREFPHAVHDHFSSATPPPSKPTSTVPTTIFTQHHEYEDEDDFDKDSMSHPLSQKLSDSLEVLKDSPQKDLRLDESLMDLDELSSSKNSVSPNEGVNVIDEFSDILSTPSGNVLHEQQQHVAGSVESVNTNLKQFERPQVTTATPFDNLSGVSSSNSSAPFGNLAGVNNSSPFGSNISDTNNSSHFGNLPDFTTTSNVTSSALKDFSVIAEDDVPPPIPPHQNLGRAGQVSSSSIIQDSESFGTTTLTGRSHKEENVLKNTSTYKYSDEPEIPARKIESGNRSETTPLDFDLGRSSRRPYEIEKEELKHGGVMSQQEVHTGGSAVAGANLMTTSLTMSSSLDEIIQPSLYESEDSSTTTNPPLLLDTETLNQELDEFLSNDSVTTKSASESQNKSLGKEGKTDKEPVVKVVQQEKVKPKIVEERQVKHRYDTPVVEFSEDVQKILNTFNPRAWFDPEKLHPKVSELVYWRDPKKSGVVFGSVFVVLLALAFLSFISVVAYTSLAVLSGTLAFRVYKSVLQAIQKTNDGHPFKEFLDVDLSVSNDKAQEVSIAVVSHLNCAASKLRSLFLVEDIVESAKFGALLYLFTYIGAWFNGLTLVILGFIALFGLPKVYETNKIIIDQYIDLVSGKISEVTAKVSAVIPFGKKEKAQ